MAQQSPTDGDVILGGGIRKWMMPSQPSAKLAGKCTRASYNTTKRISRHVVHHARHEADKVVYDGIDRKSSDIFSLANQMRKENVDVVGASQ